MRRGHRDFANKHIIKKIDGDTDDYLIDEAKRRGDEMNEDDASDDEDSSDSNSVID